MSSSGNNGPCDRCGEIPARIVEGETLCAECSPPDENACEACLFKDGTHEEHGRWLCDDCSDYAPDDIQEGD